jgi:hypothetical protein
MAVTRERRLVGRLGLRLDAREGGQPDFPAVTILIDGEETFANVGSQQYVGFDPDEILSRDAPLIPQDPARRVGIYQWDSHCGAGDGCIAPLICARSDQVVWSDLRDFTGIYDNGPVTEQDPDNSWGLALDIPDLVFDGRHYRAVVERLSADRSWESERRKTTRLLGEYLDDERERLAALGWKREWVRLYRDGFGLTFWDVSGEHEIAVKLAASPGTAEERARKMTEFLLSAPPHQWPVTGRGGRGS